MTVQLWQAALGMLGALVLAAWAALPKILAVRSENRKTDAQTMAYSSQIVIDQLQEQVKWQGGEIEQLRQQVTHLIGLIGSRDQEVGVLRSESVQKDALITQLRARVEHLEAHAA